MKCRLRKIASNHENLRTEDAVGFCEREPMIGQPFIMTSAALDPEADVRVIQTTAVMRRDYDEVRQRMYFDTRNSEYIWEFLGFGN